MFEQFIYWEFYSDISEAIIHFKDMKFLCFFGDHELVVLNKEDLLNLYNSLLGSAEDVRHDTNEAIVEKFNMFVRYLVDNILYNCEDCKSTRPTEDKG